VKIEVEDYQKIRYLYNVEHETIRAISRSLGISRQTVKKYCEGQSVPWERKHGSGTIKSRMTPDVVEFIQKCIGEDEKEKLNKQKHTAKRIYDRLVTEKGFEGAESTVRMTVAQLRGEPHHKAFIPLEYEPGEAIQVDWGECTVYLCGERIKLNLWCMRECYSSDFFCRVFFRQNQESFLEGIRDGLKHFGGSPKKIIFDNAKVAVSEGFGLHAKATDGYAAMAAHYIFEPVFCNIASGHEKGLVEGLVGFVRRNFFVPVPHVNSLEEVDTILSERAEEYRSHKIEGKTETVGYRYALTRAALKPLPPFVFETAKKCETRVDDFALLKFEKNKYSVPYKFSGKTVTVKATGNKLSVFSNNEKIAEYIRDYSTGKTHYTLNHYMELIARRPRSAVDAAPVKRTVPEQLYGFLEGLRDPHDVVTLLQIYLEKPDELLKSINESSTIESLKAMLSKTEENPPKDISAYKIEVKIPDISAYNVLVSGRTN